MALYGKDLDCVHSTYFWLLPVNGSGREPPVLQLDAVHQIRSTFSVKTFGNIAWRASGSLGCPATEELRGDNLTG
jgi:hypothetical protein